MKHYAIFLLTALVLSSAAHAQKAPEVPPQPPMPDLHLAGSELIKSADASSKSLFVALCGGLFTGFVAARADNTQRTPVVIMASLTAVASISFYISAISHKRKAGRSLHPAP